MQRIYLDNNATTPLDKRVLEEMLLDFKGPPLNPSSAHWFGQQAKKLLEEAREEISSFFHFHPQELFFTSGGTEAINLFLQSLPEKGHLITSSIEHAAVFQAIQALEKQGVNVTYLSPTLWGAPSADAVEKAIRPDTNAIVLSASNAETGVKLDFEAIGKIAEARGIAFFLDTVSFIGKEPFSPPPGVSAISISAHKFHGPKGVGALLVKKPFTIIPLQRGGSQEGAKRAGTENLGGILGMKKAISILQEEQEEITQKLLSLRNVLEEGLLQIPGAKIHGKGPRISNTTNVALEGADGETLLMQLDLEGVAVSHGSACSSGSLEPSRVLTNMGIAPKEVKNSIRISLSRMNTEEEIQTALTLLKKFSHDSESILFPL